MRVTLGPSTFEKQRVSCPSTTVQQMLSLLQNHTRDLNEYHNYSQNISLHPQGKSHSLLKTQRSIRAVSSNESFYAGSATQKLLIL